jgi:8-oxo-dGTP pyrophosphatase MutT (NUDIX family)
MEPKPSFLFRQSGVIPFRRTGDRVEVLLITSSDDSRWVIPKGVIEPDLSAAESAVKEAEEEAGIAGKVSSHTVGEFTYKKWGGTCHVDVFTLEVTEEMQDWLEARVRKREWVSIEEACTRIRDDELKALIARLPALLPS